jgi:hypothetical protein
VYTDLPAAVGFEAERRGRRVERLTVQSMIGGERDFIVTALGKEYAADQLGERPTLYAREPELLNVQLSRHKALLIAVGCVTCLAEFRLRRRGAEDPRVRETARSILSLAELGRAVFRGFSP